MQRLKRWLRRSLRYFVSPLARSFAVEQERSLLAQGKLLANWVRGLGSLAKIDEAEFCIFSQFGDDGIIQYLIHHIAAPSNTFIEFGVGDYSEANTRFLLMNDNWSGLVLDSSKENIARIRSSHYYWR